MPATLEEDKKHNEELRYCFNIDVSGDSFYNGKKQDCLQFTRSDPICTETGAREQVNSNTAYLDGGGVYGCDSYTAIKLRRLSNGLMKTNSLGPTLPTRREAGLDGEDQETLVAGDPRAHVQPGLTSIYSLLLNEHNRIANELQGLMKGNK